MIRWIGRRQLDDFINKIDDVPIYDSIIKSFNCYRHDEHEVDSVESGIVVPPFVSKFCQKRGSGHVAAIADEDGIVRLLDTRALDNSIMKAFTAHNNAIFDLEWLKNSPKLVTASGDQSAVVWDVEKHVSTAVMRGHSCSLKSIAVSNCNNIMATGARDGNVMVWDLRCHQRENGSHRPVKTIHCAHTDPAVKPPNGKRRRLSQTKPSRDSQQSVTSVIFQEDNMLLTSGATDGAIKLWDLRKSYHGPAKKPLRQFKYAGESMRRHGYSCLTLDPSCSRLYANCTDDIIYEYNLLSPSSSPVSTYTGHQNSTFYVKSCLSADGNFLLSGSSDSNAYIWKVGSKFPVVRLTGHQGEVTSVSWCPEDFLKIITCADDNTFRLWKSDSTTSDSKRSEQGIVGTSEFLSVETKDIAARQRKSVNKLRYGQMNNSNSTHGVTANLPTATANLFTKHKQKKPLKDVSLKTCWKRQLKQEKENVMNKNENKLEMNVEKENSLAELKKCSDLKTNNNNNVSPNRLDLKNKENSLHKDLAKKGMDEAQEELSQFESPKCTIKSKKMLRSYLSPTANLPNRVLDSESKREKELPQVWNNTKSAESRKVKANWLKEYSKKLGSEPIDIGRNSFLAKCSPTRNNILKKPELVSPCRQKRKVQSPERENICELLPSNCTPSSPVSSMPATSKMRKISTYFEPVTQV